MRIQKFTKIHGILNIFLPSIFMWALFTAPIASATFSDVPSHHDYSTAINYLETEKIVKGYEDGTFRPDQAISKAEFYKIAFTHAGYQPSTRLYPSPFTDVPGESWFAPYVHEALALKIIQVNQNLPSFFPKFAINRREATTMILSLEGIPTPISNYEQVLPFEDISSTDPHRHYFYAANQSGIILPETTDYFFPERTITRGQAAHLLYRAHMYRKANPDTISLPTVSLFLENQEHLSSTEQSFLSSETFPILLSVWSKINEEYIDAENINKTELLQGAINGMVESLNDPHSIFQTEQQAQSLQNSLNGTFEGIGVVIEVFDEEYVITYVLEDAPADLAGIEAGGIITKINEKDANVLSFPELLEEIQGAAGTDVSVTLMQNGSTKTYHLTREVLELASINRGTAIDIPDDIGYIGIYSFTDGTAHEFEEVLTDTLSKDPKGLVIDLRDNPGGTIQSAFDVVDTFLPSKKIIATLKSGGQLHEQYSATTATVPAELPVVVLINGGSASAAEIVAGALQDHEVATLVGEQTFGKGTVQEISIYEDGSLLKLSIAAWLTPDGNSVDGIGLTPDIMAPRTKEDALQNTDSQFEKAVEIIRSS